MEIQAVHATTRKGRINRNGGGPKRLGVEWRRKCLGDGRRAGSHVRILQKSRVEREDRQTHRAHRHGVDAKQ